MKKINKNCRSIKKGAGLVNSIINKLPVELHLPGYQYCGPGTKLNKRLKRGDAGINGLDKACKEHDIAYNTYTSQFDRHIADKILAEKAWERVKSSDSGIVEKANAYIVTNAMKMKLKTGMGYKIKKSNPKKKKKNPLKKISYRTIIANARQVLKEKKPKNFKDAIDVALVASHNMLKKEKRAKSSIKTPRIIPIPKTGGILPFLVPLFAGLSAIGSITSGAAAVAKAVNAANNAKKQLVEHQRHNETMEAIAIGKGMHLKPYKQGLGLYLSKN